MVLVGNLISTLASRFSDALIDGYTWLRQLLRRGPAVSRPCSAFPTFTGLYDRCRGSKGHGRAGCGGWFWVWLWLVVVVLVMALTDG
jgi:hypothetical protein